jgi:hypothetical protein
LQENLKTRLKFKNMKRIITLALMLSALGMTCQNIAINSTGALPAASAMLDITSTTSGLLIPRMTSAQKTAIAAPATGLIVYDTTLNAFWYYNGTAWVPLLSSATGWMLTGNSLAGTEFMGSTNAQPVKFYSNNTERARILSTGEVVVGSTTAFVNDQFSVYSTTAAINGYVSATNGSAVYGEAVVTNGIGLYGNCNTASNGRGVFAYANGAGTTLAGYVYNANVSGAGFIGTGSGATFAGGSWFQNGAGGCFNGLPLGITVYSGPSTTTNGQGGGYFVGSMSTASVANQYAYVSYRTGAIWYKIFGTGSVSSILRNQKSADKVVFCPEATEILLQDYGVGELKNGKAHIDIDPVVSQNIVVNDKHPLKVYITLKGECNGVYVTNETSTGFDVIELGKGNSNEKFNYLIVANRADEIDEKTGEIMSHNADARLPDAPVQFPTSATEPPKVPVKTQR